MRDRADIRAVAMEMEECQTQARVLYSKKFPAVMRGAARAEHQLRQEGHRGRGVSKEDGDCEIPLARVLAVYDCPRCQCSSLPGRLALPRRGCGGSVNAQGNP